MSGFAWVTLATNDSYSLGALVLAHSLRQVGTAHQLAVLVTPGVTNVMRKNLADVFNVVEEVNLFDSKDEANLRLLKRPELGVTFTKLHCWRLTQFEKCVFLDADVLVLVNSDELFERDEFSAAPDVGWPDCFNSGVFVYRPSLETYSKLVDFAVQKGSFDGGDQGLLNAYFSDWAHKDISKHLPFIYNMCSTATYSYLPAFKYYGANAKIIHFIGPAKPWLQYFDTESRQVHASPDLQHLHDVLQKWWDTFCSVIHPKLSPDMSGLAGAFAQFTLGEKRTTTQDALENHMRRQAWEGGNIDYLGRDSFDNIWSKICQTLSSTQVEETAVKDGAFSSDTPQTSVAADVQSAVQELEKPQEPKIKPESVKSEIPEAPTSEVADAPKEETKPAEAPAPQETIEVKAAFKEEGGEKLAEVSKPEDAPKEEAVPQKEETKPEEAVVKPAEQEPVSQKEETISEGPAEAPAEVPKSTDKPKEEILPAQEAPVPKQEIVSEQSADKQVPISDDKEEVPFAKVEEAKPEAPVEVPKVEAQPETAVTAKVEEKLEEVQPESVVPTEESSKVETAEGEPVIAKDEKLEIPPETPQEVITPKDEVKLEEVKTEPAAEHKSEETVPVSPVVTEEKQILSEGLVSEKEEVTPLSPVVAPEAPKEEIKESPAQKEDDSCPIPTPEAPKDDIKETLAQKEETSCPIATKEALKEEIKEAPAQKEEVSCPIAAPEALKEKIKEAPAQKEEATCPIATAKAPKEEIKETPPAKKTVVKKDTLAVKPKKVSDVPKVETKPEPSDESPKPESVAPEEAAQTETPAEASAPVPKSDAKPKEVKKIKKKVKKVVKADPAEGSEGSSKK